MAKNPLSILYQDQDLVAIDKPSGLLVHRSFIASEAREYAMQMLRDQLDRWVYPVHRLDRPTSGVLLFGLHEEAARRLTQLFAERKVQKRYAAVVRGYLCGDHTIDYALKEEVDKRERGVDPDKDAQEAVTHLRGVATVELPVPVGRYPSARYSLVSALPETGRKHQIRRHLSHISHPILGDTRHGDGRHNRVLREQFNLHRLMLVARELELPHPFAGNRLRISAPLPESWQPLFDRFGWDPELLAQAHETARHVDTP